MIAHLNQIPTEANIRKKLRRIIFGKNVWCPHCRSRRVYCSEGRYRCTRCRKPFTLFSHTWLKGTKLSLRTLWSLLWCWTQRVPVLQTMKLCHMSEPTVRFWFRAFRLQLPLQEPILNGVVQMDEAYFKHHALVLAKQEGTRNIAYQTIVGRSVGKTEAANFLFQYIAPHTRLQTDGGGMYRGIDAWWQVDHHTDIHKRWEFELTSEIEGMFGNLRTFIRRMYHHVTPDYLPELVREFCVRFSSPEIFDSPHSYLKKTLTFVPFA